MLNPVQGKADMAAGLERLASSIDGARAFVMVELKDKGAAAFIAADLRAVANALKVDPIENADHIQTRERLAGARSALQSVAFLLGTRGVAGVGMALSEVREALDR